jgi:hypothetical protein
LREVIEQRGVFCALYSDRASHFFLTPKADEPVDHTRLTQVARDTGLSSQLAYCDNMKGIKKAFVAACIDAGITMSFDEFVRETLTFPGTQTFK